MFIITFVVEFLNIKLFAFIYLNTNLVAPYSMLLFLLFRKYKLEFFEWLEFYSHWFSFEIGNHFVEYIDIFFEKHMFAISC